MDITVQSHPDAVVLQAAGRVDTNTASDFTSKASEVLASKPQRLFLDFSQVEFLSSMGLRALLTLAKSARRQSTELALAAPPDSVRKVLTMSGFDQFLPILDAVPDDL